MADRALLIDQGNTRLKWVAAEDGEILEQSAGRGDFDGFKRACVSGLDRPERVLFSSVAGRDAAQQLTGFCESHWSLEARQLQSESHGGGVRNGYPEPAKLGVDRWLAIVGAVACHGKPVVVWDLGTASTLDAVDQDGQHIGGMIYPGPSTMLNSLARDTKLSVPTDLAEAGISPGRTTAICIRNGVFAAQLGTLNQFLRSTQEETGARPKLVVTGGAAGGILPLLDFECIHDPWLVFRGMLTEGIR